MIKQIAKNSIYSVNFLQASQKEVQLKSHENLFVLLPVFFF